MRISSEERSKLRVSKLYASDILGCGAAVTGSMHGITVDKELHILDCGLVQGHRKEAFQINSHFPFDPEDVRSVVLSHAHLDHSGNLAHVGAKRLLREDSFDSGDGGIVPVHAGGFGAHSGKRRGISDPAFSEAARRSAWRIRACPWRRSIRWKMRRKRARLFDRPSFIQTTRLNEHLEFHIQQRRSHFRVGVRAAQEQAEWPRD